MNILIGSASYELKKFTKKSMVDRFGQEGADVYGFIDDEFEAVLSVREDLCKQTKQLTFWHEVTHGMLDEIGREDLSCNESVVDSLSKQLYGFYKNNNIDKIYDRLGQ